MSPERERGLSDVLFTTLASEPPGTQVLPLKPPVADAFPGPFLVSSNNGHFQLKTAHARVCGLGVRSCYPGPGGGPLSCVVQ